MPTSHIRYDRHHKGGSVDSDRRPRYSLASTLRPWRLCRLLDAATINAPNAVGTDEADRMGVAAHHAVRPHRFAGYCAATQFGEHLKMLRVQAVAGDPLFSRVTRVTSSSLMALPPGWRAVMLARAYFGSPFRQAL